MAQPDVNGASENTSTVFGENVHERRVSGE